MPHEEGTVDYLKDKLYSRKQKGGMQDVRAPLSPSEEHAPVVWNTPQESEQKPKLVVTTQRHHMALATKFLIGSVVFFVLAMAGALLFFFTGGNYISTENIDLEVVSPALIDGGAAASLQFIITNRNTTDLELADLVITYPEGTRDPKDPEKALSHERISVGTIAPGRQIKLTSKALFYGSEGEAQTIKVSLEYSVQGSNAIFIKEGSAVITIGSSPISVRIDAPSEAIAGQPFTIALTIQSNAEEAVQDVVVQAQYPFGFSVQSAVPKADAGSVMWRLGTMEPGTTKTISITGAIDGQDGDERVFRFLAGTNDDLTAGTVKVPFLSVPTTLTVHRPFITATLTVDSKTGETISASAGKVLQGTVVWQNNLSESVSDLQVVLTFTGPAFDKGSVQSGNGFYQSNDNTITWTAAEEPSLADVPPGGTGTLNFGFTTKAPGTGGVVYTNPVVDLSLSIGAVRAGQGNVPTKVTSAAAMEILLSSSVSLSAQALHYTGPFTNSGQVPPRAESSTSYTIQWTVKNSSNAIANGVVSTVLPAYVSYVEAAPGSTITFDQGTRTVRWNVGEIKAGVGYSTAAKTGAFKVMLNPSISQVGSVPPITGTTVLSGTDRFAQVPVSASGEAPTTKLSEAGFSDGMDIVQPKQ